MKTLVPLNKRAAVALRLSHRNTHMQMVILKPNNRPSYT